jgi:hypothetical protein
MLPRILRAFADLDEKQSPYAAKAMRAAAFEIERLQDELGIKR